jgi:hypothetical protein
MGCSPGRTRDVDVRQTRRRLPVPTAKQIPPPPPPLCPQHAGTPVAICLSRDARWRGMEGGGLSLSTTRLPKFEPSAKKICSRVTFRVASHRMRIARRARPTSRLDRSRSVSEKILRLSFRKECRWSVNSFASCEPVHAQLSLLVDRANRSCRCRTGGSRKRGYPSSRLSRPQPSFLPRQVGAAAAAAGAAASAMRAGCNGLRRS